MSYINPLEIDGEKTRLRLQAERQFTGSMVHVDWVRFTCLVKNAPTPSVEVLFPHAAEADAWDVVNGGCGNGLARRQRVVKLLQGLPNEDFAVSAQAFTLAEQVSKALGPDFVVEVEPRNGMDFYKFRWSITLNGHECGWVGFLANSDSPKQQKQNGTIHANVMGTACTFAAPGWAHRIADLIDETAAVLTRSDLALDFFGGIPGGIEQVRLDYRNGLCNVGGRKLKFNMVGDWENGHDRSLYIGSREAGKITNVYEKGDQLFGEKSGSEWLRFELRFGNKLRVLPSDVLRRPDDFFAGASDWHESVLLSAGRPPSPSPILTTPRLQLQTVQAECSRNIRWLVSTAASTVAVALTYLSENDFMDLVGNAKLPVRLRKFSLAQIAECFSPAVKTLSPFPALVKVPGSVATYSLSMA